MKQKQKVDTIVALFLILIGTLLLLMPLYNYLKIKTIIIIIFGLYTIINLTKFILTIKEKDYEGLHASLASLLIMIICFFLKLENNPRLIAMTLMAWIILMSLAKLKKIDYYHDRRDRMWKIKTFILSLFILAGLLTSINLAHEEIVQIIILGYFMLIHGILELFEPIIKTIISHS